MNKIYYKTDDGFKELGEVQNIELTAETINETEYKRFLHSESIEFTGEIIDLDNLERALLGQSRYNAMKLKRDGYLSPENGWITKG